MSKFSEDLKNVVSPKFTENLLVQIVEETFSLRNATVTDISFNSDSKKGDSYLSTVTRFVVKATGEDRRNEELKNVTFPLICKSLPANIARRKTFRSLDFFNNEVIFYNTVWKAMNEFQMTKCPQGVFRDIPRCVSALADGTNDYIVMEDLNFKGYGSAARSDGLDFNHVQLIMRLFAKFHALSLAFKDQQPGRFEEIASSLQETYFSEKQRGWYINFQTQNLYPVVRDAVQKQLPQQYLSKFDEMFKTDFFGTLIYHAENRNRLAVITHGDAWIPNFLLTYDKGGAPLTAMMIDFQLARYASLALDVTFFLYSCTDQSLRTEHWDELIEDYHKTFVNTLQLLGSSADLLTLDDLKAEIKRCGVFGIGMSMEAITMSLLEDDETADLDKIQGDEAVPLEEVWVIHPFKTEAKRQRMADIIKHAVDNHFI